MDPGTALAVVSLAFQAFAGTVQAFRIIQAATRTGQEAERFVLELRLLEHRLFAWADRTGLSRDGLDPQMPAELVCDTLAQMKSLIHDSERLLHRYGIQMRESPPQGHAPLQLPAANIRADIEEREQEIITRARRTNQFNSPFKKLWFAISDGERWRQLINDLHSHMNGLESMLNYHEQWLADQRYRQNQICHVSTQENVQSVQRLLESLPGAARADASINIVAQLKQLQIVMDSSNTNRVSQLPDNWRPPILEAQSLVKIPSDSSATKNFVAKYAGLPVYCESKPWVSDGNDPGPAKWQTTRVHHLATLLHVNGQPESFHTLRCLGYVHDVRQMEFTLAFERPNNADVKPRSLAYYYKQKSFLPSIEERWRLAEEIATTLLCVHAGGWVHEGLRSENVVFFPESESPALQKSLERPYVMGYESARIDARGQMSEKSGQGASDAIYRHPLSVHRNPAEEPYIKAYDIYGLGIILLELAYFRSLKSIISSQEGRLLQSRDIDVENVTKRSLMQLRRWLTDDTIDATNRRPIPSEISFRMGKPYCSAVMACLGSTFDAEEPHSNDLIRKYLDLVVRPLQQCRFV